MGGGVSKPQTRRQESDLTFVNDKKVRLQLHSPLSNLSLSNFSSVRSRSHSIYDWKYESPAGAAMASAGLREQRNLGCFWRLRMRLPAQRVS